MNYQKQRIFKALSSETRFKLITNLIGTKPTSVEAIADAMGMSHSAVSHQLAILLGAKIVSCEKSGRHMLYQIAKAAEGKMVAKLMRISI